MEMEPETEMQQFEEFYQLAIIEDCGQAVHDIIEAEGPGQGGGCSSRNSDSEHLIGEECNKSIHSTSFDNRYEENSMSIPGDVFTTVPRSLSRKGSEESELSETIEELDLATASESEFDRRLDLASWGSVFLFSFFRDCRFFGIRDTGLWIEADIRRRRRAREVWRRALEEKVRRIVREVWRRALEEEVRRRALEDEERREALEECRRAREVRRRALEEEVRRIVREVRRRALEEEERREALENEERREALEECRRAQEEEEREREEYCREIQRRVDAAYFSESQRRALEDEAAAAARLEEKRKVLLMSAVALLYQCLIGYTDRGGTKTYSSSSLEFRPTYVSIVLFQGAYVWIKFRDVPPSGYRRPNKIRLEVRYKPPRRSGVTNYIHLCMCDTEEEARIYKKIARRYYDERNDGKLDLGNGDFFVIPPMPIEQEQAPSVSEKIIWVQGKVKEVYEDFLKAKDHARSQPNIANNTDGDHDLAVPLIESSWADDSEGHLRCGPVQPSSMLATELPPTLLYQRPDLVSAPQDNRAFPDHDNVGVDKEALVRGEILQPVEPALRTLTAVSCAPLSGGPSIALDHGFGAKEVEMMNLSPVHGDNADPLGISVDDYFPKGEFEMFAALPQQHVQDNNARESPSAAVPMVDDLNPPGTESDARSQLDIANNTDGDHGDTADPFGISVPDGYFREGDFEIFNVLLQEHFHDNNSRDQVLPSAAVPMVDDLNPPGTESVETPSDLRLEGIPNIVQEACVVGATVNEVDYYFLEEEFEMPDVLPQQHFQDNNARESPSAAAPMVDDLNPPGTESVESLDLRLEGIPNVVQEACVVGATVNEVGDGEGALHDSQASESPFKSPVLTIQGGSDTMTLHLYKIAPSVTSLGPPVPTPDLLVSLAQHIQERDGKIEEQKQQIEEQKQQHEGLKQQHEEQKQQIEEQKLQIEELKQQHEGLKQQIYSLVQ